MTYFLANCKLPTSYVQKISEYGKVILLPEFEALESPVNAHPDMLAVNVCGKLFIHKENTKLASLLSSCGITFCASNAEVGKKYPHDVSLNLFKVKNVLFSCVKHASKEIVSYAKDLGLETVNVKQGYTKCSSMILGEGIVTADTSIYGAALLHGVPALLICPGHIDIEKYNTGFIGGASFELCHGKTAVFGDISTHPEHEKILEFAKEQGCEIVSLGEGNLFDYGGIVRVDT